MINDTLKYKELENMYFPPGHTFVQTRKLLNDNVFLANSKNEWMAKRRCNNFSKAYCEYLSSTGREYVYDDNYYFRKNRLHDDSNSNYYVFTLKEKTRAETNSAIIIEKICVDDLYKLDDCSLIYGECDKHVSRLYNREYNHETMLEHEFKYEYEKFKNDGTLRKIEPYFSWIDNTLCNCISNVPKSIITIIACHCCSILNNGCPMSSKIYDLSTLNTFQFLMIIDLIKKCFTFKSNKC